MVIQLPQWRDLPQSTRLARSLSFQEVDLFALVRGTEFSDSATRSPKSSQRLCISLTDPLSQSKPLTAVPSARTICLTLVVVWMLGGLARWLNLQFPDERHLSQVAGMILFCPATVACMWLGWKNSINLRDLLTVGMVAFSSFAVWNGIMLRGLEGNILQDALVSNVIHWSLYFLMGVVVARYVQWSTSVGIWSDSVGIRSGKERAGCAVKPPAKLSVRKLLFLMFLVGCGSLAYRIWITPVPTGASNASMFHWFPIELKPFISALIGGLLLPFQWLITWAILRAKSYRLAALVVWIPCLMFVRWGTGQVYWETSTGVAILGTDALESKLADEISSELDSATGMEIASGNQAIATYMPYPAPPALPRQLPWSVYGVEAIVQQSLLFLAFLWLQFFGFRVGRWAQYLRNRYT
jgi:hypothetical protein